jgi:hypothetical protein
MISILLTPMVAAADLETLRQEGIAALGEGRNEDAVRIFGQITDEYPDDGMAQYRMGVLLMDSGGDLDQAIAHFERAAELNFQVMGVGYRLARARARMGDEDAALEHLEAIAAGGFPMIGLIEGEEDFMSLEGEPRFEAAVDQIRTARYPCEGDPRAHAFDFWIGEWDVYAGGALAGTNSVYPILGHCALSENWTAASGNEGKSYNYYDPGYDHWRQIWISDTQGPIEFVGEARDGGIFYTAETINPADGSVTMHDFSFTVYDNGDVRQLWHTSTDGGETWNTIWDGRYVRKEAETD